MQVPKGQLKWGFFGAGKCTHDFVSALKLLPSENHKSVGIASRNLERAEKFATNHKLPKYYGSYEELANDNEIDVIYIGTVNSEHYKQAKIAIQHGKHVLCEKPICVNSTQLKELVEMAKTEKVFFMEGFWTTCFPAMKKLQEELEKNCIGEVIHMSVEIGHPCGQQDRFRLKEIGGGATMNYGVYGIMLANLLLGKPDKIVASGHLSHTGVDESTVITMSYNITPKMATLILSSRAKLPGELRLIGTLGTLKVEYPFFAPLKVQTPKGPFHFDLPQFPPSIQFNNNPFSAGFVYEADEVRRCINNGLLESPLMPLSLSISTMEVADEVRRQIGVTFDQD